MKRVMTIRIATRNDYTRITEIYNEAIINTTATLDLEPRTEEEQQRWFQEHTGNYKLFVSVENDYVTGWGSLSKFCDREGYNTTVEYSEFVDKEFRGQGIGKKLLKELISSSKLSGFHTAIVRIAKTNEPSIRLTQSFGFKEIGVMKEVGFKFGNYIDISILQLLLNSID